MKLIPAIIAIVLGLAGLGMTACGAVFSFAGVVDKGMMGLLLISIPAALIGIFLVWLAWKIWKGSQYETPPANDPTPRP